MFPILGMPLYVNIRPWWPKGEDGQYQSVNSVWERFKDTDIGVNRNTLRLAFNGDLDRGKFENLSKLAAIASALSGSEVSISELLEEPTDD